MGSVMRGKFVPMGFYAAFQEALSDAIKTLANNNRYPIRPNVNRIMKRTSLRRNPDIQDLPIGQQ